MCCEKKTKQQSGDPCDLLIIISRCQSRLWIAVISIDVIASTRFLQTIPRLIDCRRHFSFVIQFERDVVFRTKRKRGNGRDKQKPILLVFIGWIVTWLRIIVISIDIRTGFGFLEIRSFIHAYMQTHTHTHTPIESTFGTYIVLGKIRMIFLDAVVQDGHNNVLSRKSQPPRSWDIHCSAMLVLVMLNERVSRSEMITSARRYTPCTIVFPIRDHWRWLMIMSILPDDTTSRYVWHVSSLVAVRPNRSMDLVAVHRGDIDQSHREIVSVVDWPLIDERQSSFHWVEPKRSTVDSHPVEALIDIPDVRMLVGICLPMRVPLVHLLWHGERIRWCIWSLVTSRVKRSSGEWIRWSQWQDE